ncbi:hypothetical protein M0R45_026597 [Rubus argutus]|uniref:Uncharacterized protein n=1 Tax=Rubus argutus TaxID=59490 RepID=A0AAW1X0I6_RUBAR
MTGSLSLCQPVLESVPPPISALALIVPITIDTPPCRPDRTLSQICAVAASAMSHHLHRRRQPKVRVDSSRRSLPPSLLQTNPRRAQPHAVASSHFHHRQTSLVSLSVFRN